MRKLLLPGEAVNYRQSKMSIEELNTKLDNKTFNNDDIIKVKLLLDAVNDWPDGIDSLADFLLAIKVDLESSDLGYIFVNKKFQN